MNTPRTLGSDAPAADDLAALRQRLADLVGRVLGDFSVAHDAPAAAAGKRSVGLYLLAFESAATAARQMHMLQFNARFLVTVRDADAVTGTDALAALLFAALDEPALDVGLEPLPAAAWSAFGVPPQPCFTLTAPVRQRRDTHPAPPVRERILRLGPANSRGEGEAVLHIDLPSSHS